MKSNLLEMVLFYIKTMSSLNFDYQHTPFNKTIQLYGDRAGGQGNFEFAGFAQLKETKIVLLKGNAQSLEQPTDWRRFLRLINLAQRINKPLLLWNMPFSHIANPQNVSLTLSTEIQNVQRRLLKLPLPIITVFDDEYASDMTLNEIGWTDGAVLMKTKVEKLQTALRTKGQCLKIVEEQTDIAQQVSDLLKELSQVPKEKLINNRLEALRSPLDKED